jgi:predicted site-specific integrase-resolvase
VRATPAERMNVFGLFNVSEAARQLGVGIQQFHRDIRAGRCKSPQIRVGRRCYFKSDDLKDLATQYKEGQGR